VVCENFSKDEVMALFYDASSEQFKALFAMTEELKKHKAQGIAANQVGFNKSMFIFSTNKGGRLAINPEILSYGIRETVVEEGCLSWPGHRKMIRRPKKIMVNYIDENGDQHTKEQLDGNASRIFQHEFDHLRGVLIQDLDEEVGWVDARLCKAK
jgi:peptide deformylase